jgi:hypothetical protein
VPSAVFTNTVAEFVPFSVGAVAVLRSFLLLTRSLDSADLKYNSGFPLQSSSCSGNLSAPVYVVLRHVSFGTDHEAFVEVVSAYLDTTTLAATPRSRETPSLLGQCT